jgi:hypothetical protein
MFATFVLLETTKWLGVVSMFSVLLIGGIWLVVMTPFAWSPPRRAIAGALLAGAGAIALVWTYILIRA